MKNYIGRKCKGFRFESVRNSIGFNVGMEEHIGEIGEIVYENQLNVMIQFKKGGWYYPISLIEPHLIPETPEIPQLGEGIEMEVSNALIPWQKRKIIAKRHDGLFIDDNGILWPHARPIQEVKKYTKEELVKIVGHDFEII
jgi:hypothetical protein